MTAAFDPLDAAREQISAAMTGAVRAGEGDPAAKADPSALESRVTATLCRTLMVRATALLAAMAARAGIAIGLARALCSTPGGAKPVYGWPPPLPTTLERFHESAGDERWVTDPTGTTGRSLSPTTSTSWAT